MIEILVILGTLLIYGIIAALALGFLFVVVRVIRVAWKGKYIDGDEE